MQTQNHSECFKLPCPDKFLEVKLEIVDGLIVLDEVVGRIHKLSPNAAWFLADKLKEFAVLVMGNEPPKLCNNKEKAKEKIIGTPEELYQIPSNYQGDDNKDVLNCTIARSKAILNMIYWGIEEGNFTPETLANAIWTVDGLLTQAKEVNQYGK